MDSVIRWERRWSPQTKHEGGWEGLENAKEKERHQTEGVELGETMSEKVN